MSKEENSRFCIVSKDLGYEVLLEFWKDKNIRLIDTISTETKKSIKERSELEENLRQMIPGEVVELILPCIGSGKSKLLVNNLLVKKYGSKKAGELYKKIKPFLKEKK